jgi:uncharacterized protein YgbK (DUF1537 family)
MPFVLIIADDLTGAADTGVKFTATGPVTLIGLEHGAVWDGLGNLSVNTETRNEPAQSIAGSLRRLNNALNSNRPELVYKKVDSCLRGFIGLELSVILEVMGFQAALVAPAYPEFKRATIEGIHLVGGLPVSETESGRDPIRPVLDSRLSAVVGEGHNFPVETLPLNLIRRGSGAVAETLEKLLSSKGKFILASDAETTEDLNTLAKAALGFQNKLLLSGSAGLAGAVAKELRQGPPNSRAHSEPNSPGGPAIFFGGSTSHALKDQLEFLALNDQGNMVTLDVESLIHDWEQLLPSPSLDKPLIVSLPNPQYEPDGSEKHSSHQIIRAFGQLAAELVRRDKPKTIFVSGGDTAREVLGALSIRRLAIESEISPGVVFLSYGPMSILTKSGGFGAKDLLSRLYRQYLSPSPH